MVKLHLEFGVLTLVKETSPRVKRETSCYLFKSKPLTIVVHQVSYSLKLQHATHRYHIDFLQITLI